MNTMLSKGWNALKNGFGKGINSLIDIAVGNNVNNNDKTYGDGYNYGHRQDLPHQVGSAVGSVEHSLEQHARGNNNGVVASREGVEQNNIEIVEGRHGNNDQVEALKMIKISEEAFVEDKESGGSIENIGGGVDNNEESMDLDEKNNRNEYSDELNIENVKNNENWNDVEIVEGRQGNNDYDGTEVEQLRINEEVSDKGSVKEDSIENIGGGVDNNVNNNGINNEEDKINLMFSNDFEGSLNNEEVGNSNEIYNIDNEDGIRREDVAIISEGGRVDNIVSGANNDDIMNEKGLKPDVKLDIRGKKQKITNSGPAIGKGKEVSILRDDSKMIKKRKSNIGDKEGTKEPVINLAIGNDVLGRNVGLGKCACCATR